MANAAPVEKKQKGTVTPFIVVTGRYLTLHEATRISADIEEMVKEKYGENVQATVRQEEWHKIEPESPNRVHVEPVRS